jgi:crotonobetainyl-CoA:carnitine CoA-transferase CaiB-like acyl-CoA transferase
MVDTTEEKKGPLTGIRVLDLSDENGSFCSKILADLGAYVIKLEKPQGDKSRRIGPFLSTPSNGEYSISFMFYNSNKLGITLNLEHRTGRKLFLRLVKKNDVLVETFPPGYLDLLGFGFEALRKVNEGLIVASITGFGQKGRRKDFKSCNLVASAMGGQMYLNGSPSLPPLQVFGEQPSLTASLFAVTGILLALRRRHTRGRGDHIDISTQDAVASTLEDVMVRYFHEQVVSERCGDRYRNDFFSILPCRDGFIHMTPFIEWDTLISLLDQEGMAEDLSAERWNDPAYRLKNRDHVIEVIKKWMQVHSVDELFELGQSLRLPWAPVRSPEQILKCSQLKARGFFRDYNFPGLNHSLEYPGAPYRFSLFPAVKQSAAPLPGQDNARIYGKELGLRPKALAYLSSNGVI